MTDQDKLKTLTEWNSVKPFHYDLICVKGMSALSLFIHYNVVDWTVSERQFFGFKK